MSVVLMAKQPKTKIEALANDVERVCTSVTLTFAVDTGDVGRGSPSSLPPHLSREKPRQQATAFPAPWARSALPQTRCVSDGVALAEWGSPDGRDPGLAQATPGQSSAWSSGLGLKPGQGPNVKPMSLKASDPVQTAAGAKGLREHQTRSASVGKPARDSGPAHADPVAPPVCLNVPP